MHAESQGIDQLLYAITSHSAAIPDHGQKGKTGPNRILPGARDLTSLLLLVSLSQQRTATQAANYVTERSF